MFNERVLRDGREQMAVASEGYSQLDITTRASLVLLCITCWMLDKARNLIAQDQV